MGATVSDPYFACAAAISACLWVASSVGDSSDGATRRFDNNFATCDGDKSA